VPGDPEELQRASAGRRGLETFGQSGYLGIESGYQAVLLGSRIPVAPAAHVPWAKPYARGRFKLLIITTFGNAAADVAELAQVTRELDVDVHWLLVAENAITHPELNDERYRTVFLPEQARALLREDFAAIVMTFGTNTPQYGAARAHPYLPDSIMRSILDKVEHGTGLVVVGQCSGGYWVNGTPLEAALPARMTDAFFALHGADARLSPEPESTLLHGLDFQPTWFTPSTPLMLYDWKLRPDARVLARLNGRPAVMTRAHGQGRIVLLGWDGTLGPRRHAGRAQLEHSTALTLRAISYAAHKEPETQLALTAEPVRAGEPGSVHATLSQAAELQLTVRDDTFRPLHVLTLQAHAGDNVVQLPALAKASYFLEARARDAKHRVHTWADQTLTAAGPEQLTVVLDKPTYRVGETVHASTRGAQLPEAQPLAARWSVRDATGRVLAEHNAPFTADAHFEYAITAALTAPHKVVLEVSRAGAPLLRETATFFVPQSGWDDYENVLWPTNRSAPTNRQLRDEAGITAVFDGYGQDEVSSNVAHYGQKIARLNDAATTPGLVQTQPLQAAQSGTALLERALDSAQRYGSLLWLLQDERHQIDDAGAPDAEGLARFRKYLRARYGGLAALNASWGSHYSAWAQVQPTLTAAVQSGDVKNLAPWLDFRLYVADQSFELDAHKARTIREALGPSAVIGIDGFTTSQHALPYGAIDFGRLASERVFNFYSPYADDFVLASLVRGPRARYAGWSSPRAEYFGAPWRDAFRGYWGSLRFFGPTFWSDFGHVQPAGRWIGESTRELRQGVGKLLIGSERALSPVVILYSYPSLVANSGAQFAEPRHGGAGLSEAAAESRGVLEQTLWAAGVSFGYQTDAQVARGALAGKRLLIVPRQMGLAMSNATARAIEQFVRAGGSVLADMAPGLLDEHGKPRARGALDVLFGVHSGGETVVHAARDFRAAIQRAHALLPEGEWLMDEWYDKGLRVTDGTSHGAHVLDAAPAFVVKRSGRGHTLLLNTMLATQLPDAASGWPEQHALMRAVLAASGVTPLARVESLAGEPQTHCEVNCFRDGANAYCGFYAHSDPDEVPAQLHARFPEALETYDVRKGQYLGRVSEVALPLRAHEAALFARLEYTLRALTLSAPPAAARGQTVTVDLELSASATPGRHVVHVDVITPNGEAAPLYAQNVVLQAGRGQLRVTTALNDPKGTWQLEAREVVSGLRARGKVVFE
jgi:hypothetical protein